MASDYKQARMFLARVLPWPTEDRQQEYVNLHHTFIPNGKEGKTDKNGKQETGMTGRAYRDVGELVGYMKFADGLSRNRDFYFCTSTQNYAIPSVSGKGKPYLKAARSSDAATLHKALFIDCDLKDGDHGYASKKELITALAAFLKATKLPKPTIFINTGGGYHIYWVLATPLPTDEWSKLAYALAEATKREGLKCDSQCTIDASRLLRIPDTRNFKYDPPRPVTIEGTPLDFDYFNEKISAALEPYKVAVPFSVKSVNVSMLPPRPAIEGVSDLTAGIDMSSYAPVTIDSLIPECPFIADAMSNGGVNNPNPLWNLTTLIATFTENGRSNAHTMSKGHQSYGPGETDELYDRKVHEKTTRNMGWPKCQTVASSGCSFCAACPHFKEGKSPLNFGSKVTPQGNTLPNGQGSPLGGVQGSGAPTLPGIAQSPSAALLAGPTIIPGTGVQDPDLPNGYIRDQRGIVMTQNLHDDGTSTWYPVSNYPMTSPWMQRDPWSINFTTVTEFNKTSQVCVPCKEVGTGEMKRALQEQGFMVTGGLRGFGLISDFIMAWVTKLQSQKDMIITSVPFGWMVRGGKTHGFVYGGKLHTANGVEPASNTDPELARQFEPTGERQHWLDAAKMITDQQRPGLDAIIASAFGAPLVRFTGHSGLLMSAYSMESGIGKSTALRIAQAVWGDPVKAIQSLSDTQNSVLNKLGELRSLPMFWDELKSEEDTKKFVDTVFRLTLGKEKSRMRSNVTQRTPGTWQTIMVSASNESLMDVVAYKTRATTAGIYRVFEYTLAPAAPGSPGQIDPTLAQRMTSKLNDNYGVIGMEYAGYLGSNAAMIENDMANTMSQIGKEVGMHADERFWIGLIASILLGAKYANLLGYTQIDQVLLKSFMYNTLQDMRRERNSQPVDMRNVVNVVNVLGRFLNDRRAKHTLYTSSIHRGRGKPAAGTIQIVRDHTRLDAIHVHVGVDDHIVRIGQSYLQEWLKDNNYPRHVFMRAMETTLNSKTVLARLGAGTNLTGASEYVIEIDISGTPSLNFIDEA